MGMPAPSLPSCLVLLGIIFSGEMERIHEVSTKMSQTWTWVCQRQGSFIPTHCVAVHYMHYTSNAADLPFFYFIDIDRNLRHAFHKKIIN
jgi:hypothetical protein